MSIASRLGDPGEKDVQTITNKPPAARPAAHAPAGGFFSSPLFFRVHAALTGALALGFLVLGVLAASGHLRFGKATAASDPERDKARADASDPPNEKDKDNQKDKAKEGRYQIEVMDDAHSVLSEAGKLGVLGSRLREAWVFRYKGGYLECKAEADLNGEITSTSTVPDWGRVLDADPDLLAGKPEVLNKEGFVVLMGVVPAVTMDEALHPLHPHLGAMFTAGPAGPLHTLVPHCLEVWNRREYRLLITANPPKGQTGTGFTTGKTGETLLIRSYLNNYDTGADQPPPHVTIGKDLEPGKELTIFERERGRTTVRLKTRFLTDKEAIEKARANQ
jgi:hypothetical protein